MSPSAHLQEHINPSFTRPCIHSAAVPQMSSCFFTIILKKLSKRKNLAVSSVLANRNPGGHQQSPAQPAQYPSISRVHRSKPWTSPSSEFYNTASLAPLVCRVQRSQPSTPSSAEYSQPSTPPSVAESSAASLSFSVIRVQHSQPNTPPSAESSTASLAPFRQQSPAQPAQHPSVSRVQLGQPITPPPAKCEKSIH